MYLSPSIFTAITLSRLPRTKTPLASLQQTATRPRAPAWRLAGFPIFGRECRILVRAHGSVAPGSSCPGGDLTPLRGAAGSGSAQTQESIRAKGRRWSRFFFSRPASAVGPSVKGCVPCPRGQPSPPSTSGALAPSGAAIMAPSPGATDKRCQASSLNLHIAGGLSALQPRGGIARSGSSQSAPNGSPNFVAPGVLVPQIDRSGDLCKCRRACCLDLLRASFDRILLFTINRGMASDHCD